MMSHSEDEYNYNNLSPASPSINTPVTPSPHMLEDELLAPINIEKSHHKSNSRKTINNSSVHSSPSAQESEDENVVMKKMKTSRSSVKRKRKPHEESSSSINTISKQSARIVAKRIRVK